MNGGDVVHHEALEGVGAIDGRGDALQQLIDEPGTVRGAHLHGREPRDAVLSAGVGGEEHRNGLGGSVRFEREGWQVAELPRVGGHAVVGACRWLLGVDAGDATGQLVVGGHGDRDLTLRHGRMLLECLGYVEEGIVAHAGGEGVIEIDRGANLEARVRDDHLGQVVVGWGIGGEGGQDFVEGVIWRLDDGAVSLARVALVDLERLKLLVVDDKRLTVELIKSHVRIQLHLLAVVKAHAAVGVPGVLLDELVEDGFGLRL